MRQDGLDAQEKERVIKQEKANLKKIGSIIQEGDQSVMKNVMKKLAATTVILTLTLSGAAQTEAEKKQGEPKINNNILTCGNKKLTFSQDGTIKLFSVKNEYLAKIYMYNAYKHEKIKQEDWVTFTSEKSKMTVEKERISWSLQKSLPDGTTWDAGTQLLSIQEDGTIRVCMNINRPPEDSGWKFMYEPMQVFIHLPKKKADGKTILYNNKTKRNPRMTDKEPFNDWSSSKYIYVPYADSAENSFTISAEKGEVDFTTMYPVAADRSIRIVYTFLKDDDSAEFVIDLRSVTPEPVK